MLNWKSYIYGDENGPGLLKELSKRVGILSKLRPLLPDDKFNKVVSGIFYSKLIYCMAVWTGVWNIPGQLEDGNKTSITKADMRKLQILQNKVLRLQTRLDRSTLTKVLLSQSKALSVHQLGAFSIASQLYSVYKTKKPVYHHNRLFAQEPNEVKNMVTRSSELQNIKVNFKLSIARGSFFYQGARLFQSIPNEIWNSISKSQFKSKCKKWIKENISVKP